MEYQKKSYHMEAVCGSAHYQIAAYWSRVLNKPAIKAYQASRRGIVLTANYKGGSITVFSQDKKGKLQRDTKIIVLLEMGRIKKRQEQSHLHCVTFTPDGKFLLATDLGTDCIYLFPIGKRPEAGKAHSLLDESRVVRIQMDSGSGPRHICFHPNGRFAYLISELSGKITVFSYNEGKLERLQTIVCDPFVAEGNADIHVSSDGKFLYASKHLKEDGIIVYSIDSQKGTLVQIGFQPTGLYPRSFAISPDGCYLAVVCRDANCIQIFERNRNTGLLKNTGKISDWKDRRLSSSYKFITKQKAI